ncbi:MAG: di-heme enzyme [Zoogloea sp.]|nr:di-heme enzyme [Zoogloea sp.]
MSRRAWIAAAAFGLCAVAQAAEDYDWKLPAWVPLPVVPADNPMSAAKVELGRRLFHDKRLSRDGSMACASCHVQRLAFSDGKRFPKGVTGEQVARSSMALVNVAYLPTLTWGNPNVKSLELQALTPLFGEHPTELGLVDREGKLYATLAADPDIRRLFAEAFPEVDGAINLSTLTKAIAAWERTLISVDAPYDRYRYGGDKKAISAAAKRGEQLFFGERLECYHCHGGFNFTDNMQHRRLAFPEWGFHNNALYNIGGTGAYPPDNPGLSQFSGKAEDDGKFRTPTLRNIAVTAPYMHDGSLASLREVIRHYAAGGRTLHGGPYKGVGADNPNKSQLVSGFRISERETRDLIAFLKTLTDSGFLTDARFSDPYAGAGAKAARHAR